MAMTIAATPTAQTAATATAITAVRRRRRQVIAPAFRHHESRRDPEH